MDRVSLLLTSENVLNGRENVHKKIGNKNGFRKGSNTESGGQQKIQVLNVFSATKMSHYESFDA